jgi:hypothetical protein
LWESDLRGGHAKPHDGEFPIWGTTGYPAVRQTQTTAADNVVDLLLSGSTLRGGDGADADTVHATGQCMDGTNAGYCVVLNEAEASVIGILNDPAIFFPGWPGAPLAPSCAEGSQPPSFIQAITVVPGKALVQYLGGKAHDLQAPAIMTSGVGSPFWLEGIAGESYTVKFDGQQPSTPIIYVPLLKGMISLPITAGTAFSGGIPAGGVAGANVPGPALGPTQEALMVYLQAAFVGGGSNFYLSPPSAVLVR